ncbi:MAG: MgtC/SapB family protein [Candidatus Pacebacteria bacterium]|nr:MgtC/SapB family protein [Candidatus Paceibacterota bacterium]
MEIMTLDIWDTVMRLGIALVLGLVLGLERVFANKSAGMRTYGLVAMASAFFVYTSQLVSMQYLGVEGFTFDPLRVAAQIVVGVGFLGTGLIVFQNNHIANLTTAAGLWVAASIGMAAGFGLFTEAVIVTVLALVTLVIFSFIERPLRKRIGEKNDIES